MAQEEKETLEDQMTEGMASSETQATEEAEEGTVDPLEAAQAEAAEWKDKYLRAHADFENSKKRLEKDKNNAVSYANESFAKDILSVMDSFENALAAMNSNNENDSDTYVQMIEGVNLTYEQLKKILEKNNIKEIECESEFDPEVHQAIMQVESDKHESGQIVQVMQKGYTIKDRVLRPAMVSTAK
ncbi:nucleotide exchange factor GrpE [Sulfurovum sp. zt1-1]|uniref:Protein GrpE n=1 Tax=Sulfurovum zhangzhouensis TaxID=3019067 RepID=A0ABT7QWH0_9BACT|nr:nucleotide exchange factor GrpE [Sulfurovum zhangzhouensis]MDM5271185.1 nucleotide exchange factor GrpE [Sulfurovum zhangzhouensis]